MKNQWPIWIFIIGVIVIVLFALNYQTGREAVPISQIFDEQPVSSVDNVEYEFVDKAPLDKSALKEEPLPVQPVAQVSGTSAQPPAVTSVSPTKITQQPAQPPVSKSSTNLAADDDMTRVAFTIQIASYKDKKAAQEALAKIKNEGLSAYLVSKDLKEKGTWHRIYVGKFTSRSQAQEMLSKLQEKYKGSFVVSP